MQTNAAGKSGKQFIGQGRSASVYRSSDDSGKAVVHKVFLGEPVSRAVLFLLTGSANPYTWCESAVQSAIHRREILDHLIRYWFDDRVRLPQGVSYVWNEDARAFEVRMEFIQGHHVPLVGSDWSPAVAATADDARHATDPLPELVSDVMCPLQRHLREAGFDGLVWQAGLGNPTALANFMIERDRRTSEHRWVWIDLESGVPALFPINPLALFSFYLPRSIHHRRALFDDVDLERLRIYLNANEARIRKKLGGRAWADLHRRMRQLNESQTQWKTIRRHMRGIQYERSQERIDAETAEWYAARPLAWNVRMIGRAARSAARLSARMAERLTQYCSLRHLRFLVLWLVSFLASQQFRVRLSRRIVMLRLHSWRKRGHIHRESDRLMRRQLRSTEVSTCLTDFGVHLSIKPMVKIVQYVITPALLAFGLINLLTAAVIVAIGGAAARTLYTLGRIVQCSITGQARPWMALIVGLLPVAGNAAFAAELLYRSSEASGRLARFIVLDTFASIGRSVPIWGGADSLIEHRFNRLGLQFVRALNRMNIRRRITESENSHFGADQNVEPAAEVTVNRRPGDGRSAPDHSRSTTCSSTTLLS